MFKNLLNFPVSNHDKQCETDANVRMLIILRRDKDEHDVLSILFFHHVLLTKNKKFKIIISIVLSIVFTFLNTCK